jgi:hypothetical protein
MSMNDPTAIEELLGYQLGICDEQERWAVEARLHASPEAQRQVVLLQRVLAPLNAYDVPAPTNLVSSVLDRVAQSRSIFKFPRRKVAAADGGSGGGRATMSMRELLSLAAAITLFVGVFLPGYQSARNSAARTLCLNQMRVVGGAIGSYVEANGGMLPYNAGSALSGPPERSALPRAAANFQGLQQQNYIPDRRFLYCPGGAEPCSRPEYNFQLFFAPQSAFRLSPNFPIVSDPNPMVVNGRFIPVDALRNADTHGANAGQIVLRLNGAAGWHDRPTVGVDGDDIFRIDHPASYSQEPGRSLSEAFLIP